MGNNKKKSEKKTRPPPPRIRIPPRKNKKKSFLTSHKTAIGSLAAIALSIFLSSSYNTYMYRNGNSYSYNSLSNNGLLLKISEEEVITAWTKGNNNPNSNILHVDRVPISQMTHARFHDQYQSKHKPVILTGAYGITNSPLMLLDDNGSDNGSDATWKELQDKYGHVVLETRIPRQLSKNHMGCTGTGLCQGEPITLANLIQTYFLKNNTSNTMAMHIAPYPHDLSLEETLPDLYTVSQNFIFWRESTMNHEKRQGSMAVHLLWRARNSNRFACRQHGNIFHNGSPARPQAIHFNGRQARSQAVHGTPPPQSRLRH